MGKETRRITGGREPSCSKKRKPTTPNESERKKTRLEIEKSKTQISKNAKGIDS